MAAGLSVNQNRDDSAYPLFKQIFATNAGFICKKRWSEPETHSS